ncbi:transcription termination factor 4, mitochondrial-like isoform X1 [Sinocyclocheilus anshuiensis]|uniref:transcription termination factor 4, mitochondrial-like isoform X1 n=1 Tax=Sinocyclocheilus anshuiensis TaxID=1608454 RepID=UPI0007B9661A|nr:PREDICTED: transcription termination factor 4, mitochondrial-like isoform X1 [Sinocyclocheilus anshuiensis]
MFNHCYIATVRNLAICHLMLRWMWGWSVCPVAVSRGHMPFCSTHQANPSHSGQVTHRPGNQLTLCSLLEMGFSETQAKEMHEGATKSRGKHVPSVLTALLLLGLNPSSILKIMQKCPEVYSLKGADLQQRIDHLRKMGLIEGSLQRMISHYPKVMLLPVKRVNMVPRLLREKCLFTIHQVTDILRDSPEVLEEDLAQLEYKFQYVYFRMGVRQPEMVKAKLFRLPLSELRCRHCFLERRGLYQTPDKKGQTLILNPPLKDVLCVSEETYLTQVAMATAEEFHVFRKLMAREQEEKGREDEYSSDEDEEDKDDDDDDNGLHRRKCHWNTGYKKDRK